MIVFKIASKIITRIIGMGIRPGKQLHLSKSKCCRLWCHVSDGVRKLSVELSRERSWTRPKLTPDFSKSYISGKRACIDLPRARGKEKQSEGLTGAENPSAFAGERFAQRQQDHFNDEIPPFGHLPSCRFPHIWDHCHKTSSHCLCHTGTCC